MITRSELSQLLLLRVQALRNNFFRIFYFVPANTNCASSASSCMNSSAPSTILNSVSPHLSMSVTFVLLSTSKSHIVDCICFIASIPDSP